MIVFVEEASRLLQQGQVVAIPTETVYGLAACIGNEDAIKKIFSTKERPYFDPLIVHIADLAQWLEVVETIPESAKLLAQNLWPGPLTIILKKKTSVSSLITSGLPDVGVRFPKHPLAQQLLLKNGPLAAPSANKFGKTSPTSAAHVESEFENKVAVVDGGNCDVGIESTVIKIEESDSKVQIFILRPGALGEKEIRAALSSLQKEIHFVRKASPVESLASPGQLENHYQPASPLILANKNLTMDESTRALIEKSLNKKYTSPPIEWSFSETSPVLVARTLYSTMREKSLEASEKDTYILLRLPSNYESPEWEALRDRLEKASSLTLDKRV